MDKKHVGSISDRAMAVIRKFQQTELTEAATYRAIAKFAKGEENKKILERLAADEMGHYEIWKSYTGEEMKAESVKVFLRALSARFLGFTFTVKQMENRESAAQSEYAALAEEVPESIKIEADEEAHEKILLGMLDEEVLQYVGSMVLGLNDALVELTGTLAGLTLALQNTRIIALSGLITGISATLSMASSEFLAAKSEGRSDALKSCIYTGAAYLVTVALLIMPYLIFPIGGYIWALLTMLAIVILIIIAFNYYIAVAKDMPFKRRFLEMAGISVGVALLSFVIGLGVKNVLGVDI